MKDCCGNTIESGDTLYNPHDRDMFHIVISDSKGNLFLGDFDSPLERYAPESFWYKVIKDENGELFAGNKSKPLNY